MNTFTTEELDREEIEFLPPRVVMTACQPKPCWHPCAPKAPVCEQPTWCPKPEPVCPKPSIELCVSLKVGLF